MALIYLGSIYLFNHSSVQNILSVSSRLHVVTLYGCTISPRQWYQESPD